MPAHPIDFRINPHVFSTSELAEVFEEQAVFQRWLDFEAALATVQGELGIIPLGAAEEISRKAKLQCLDLQSIREGYGKSRNSVIPLLGGLRRACADGFGEFVHFGATTQDVLDTGEILALRTVIAILYRDLRDLEKNCLNLAREHRQTPMAARTHGQQALPTTFGLKTAVWLGEIRRHIERLQYLHTTINCGQLGAAVGTLAALGPMAMEVAEQTLKRLGLEHDPASWHTSRDKIAELASVFSILTMTLAKIANEIFQLQKTEIGELIEPPPAGVLASSTMPHKQNPVICQRVVALSRHVRALTATVVESMGHEHERDPRCLWAEWLAIPELCIYTGTSLRYMMDVLSGLTVRSDRMLENLYRRKNFITTEWLTFQLSESMGKMKALEKVHALSSAAEETGISLKDAVLDDPETGALFSPEQLSLLDRPEQYTGHAVTIVDQVILKIEEKRKVDPDNYE
ncbi:MAG: adenylosuccinate lyase [Desulfobulbaceae bacterium]|nr:adenylosuccinate lyase [Desulfobulbaceae bacterium]